MAECRLERQAGLGGGDAVDLDVLDGGVEDAAGRAGDEGGDRDFLFLAEFDQFALDGPAAGLGGELGGSGVVGLAVGEHDHVGDPFAGMVLEQGEQVVVEQGLRAIGIDRVAIGLGQGFQSQRHRLGRGIETVGQKVLAQAFGGQGRLQDAQRLPIRLAGVSSAIDCEESTSTRLSSRGLGSFWGSSREGLKRMMARMRMAAARRPISVQRTRRESVPG